MDCDYCSSKHSCEYRSRGELCPAARKARDKGRLIGGTSGAAIGFAFGGPLGAIIGGAIGALVGGDVGKEHARKHKNCES
ncbi:MAG: glycine zipper domain-containing protein [Promethearchaeota archaeon]